MPLSPKPTLKLGLDPGSPHWLTDITREVDEVDFSVGTGGRFFPRRRRSGGDDGWRDDDFELTFTANARCETIGWR